MSTRTARSSTRVRHGTCGGGPFVLRGSPAWADASTLPLIVCPVAVSRIEGKSESYQLDLVLDVHTDVYPMDVRNKFALVRVFLPPHY